MSLSAPSLEDIRWWVNNLPSSTRAIYHPNPDITVYTDASGTGWGAKLESGRTTCGIWSHAETEKHINCLELLAIQLALLSLLRDSSSIHVRIMCDNTTAVAYINGMGGSRSLECNTIAKTIWSWAIAKGIWLSAAHIVGSANVDADQLSRNLNLNLEWMFDLHTFQRIVSLFGRPNIDLFASRLNAQLQDYVSWKPDPKAKFVDAFSLTWSGFYFYASPPPLLSCI